MRTHPVSPEAVALWLLATALGNHPVVRAQRDHELMMALADGFTAAFAGGLR